MRSATRVYHGPGSAKRRAWGELLASPDADPWGRPYKMVLNKLRPWAPPTTESMDPRFLKEVVDTLFPGATDEENSKFTNEGEQEPHPSEEKSRDPAGSWSPESRVAEEELAAAVGKIGAQKAPGPDPPVEGRRRGLGPEINASI